MYKFSYVEEQAAVLFGVVPDVSGPTVKVTRQTFKNCKLLNPDPFKVRFSLALAEPSPHDRLGESKVKDHHQLIRIAKKVQRKSPKKVMNSSMSIASSRFY